MLGHAVAGVQRKFKGQDQLVGRGNVVRMEGKCVVGSLDLPNRASSDRAHLDIAPCGPRLGVALCLECRRVSCALDIHLGAPTLGGFPDG